MSSQLYCKGLTGSGAGTLAFALECLLENRTDGKEEIG